MTRYSPRAISMCLAPLLAVLSTAGIAQTAPHPEYASIPIRADSIDMVSEVFKPSGPGPFPVLVYSHGRSGTAAERANIPEVIPREYLKFWLEQGFAVVAPMRPGYGKTGGADRETPGHRWDNAGRCVGSPDFESTMNFASRAPLAVLEWLKTQPWADATKVILSGNSVGGVTTVLAGSTNPAGLIGYINFAGGIAGNPARSPGKSCDADRLLKVLQGYGKTTKVQNLWIYAQNDLYWGADAPKTWHKAFAEGGSPSSMVTTSSLANHDGHDLIFFGRALWQEPVTAFVLKLGVGAPRAQ